MVDRHVVAWTRARGCALHLRVKGSSDGRRSEMISSRCINIITPPKCGFRLRVNMHGCIPGDRFSIVARDAWIEIITLSAKPVIAHLIFRRSYLRTSIYINRVVAHFVSFCFYQLVGRITWRDRLTRNFKKDADTIGDRHRDKLPFATANIFD